MFDEVPGHVLEAAGHVDADPVHLALARLARPVRRRHLDVMHLPLDPPRLPAGAGLAQLPPGPRGLRVRRLRVRDLAIQRGVLGGQGLPIDLGRPPLPDEDVEQERELPRVEGLGVTADPFPPQFRQE